MIKICNNDAFTTDFSKQLAAASFNTTNINQDLLSLRPFDNQTDPYQVQSTYYNNMKQHGYFFALDAVEMNESLKRSLGPAIDDFLVSCSFVSSNCNKTNDFDTFYDTLLGNCIRFNSGNDMNGQMTPIKQVSNTGVLNGFSIELYLGPASQNENIFSFLNGFNVFITTQDVDLVLTNGVMAPAGWVFFNSLN